MARFPTGFHGGYHSPFHFLSVCRFDLFHSVLRFQLLWHVSPSRWFFSMCVAFQLAISGVCRLKVVFMACVSLQVVFMAYVAFRLFSWRVSPSGCFHSVCHLQAVFTACVAFQLAISGVCPFHSSFMVSFTFCFPFSVHSACRLQLVFMAMACTTYRLFSWRVSP